MTHKLSFYTEMQTLQHTQPIVHLVCVVITVFILIMAQMTFIESAYAEGNIVAYVEDGNLIIVGDAFGNDIALEAFGPDECNIYGFSTTKINGVQDITLEVTGDISIKMNAGDDFIELRCNADNVSIDTGPGNDFVGIGESGARYSIVTETGPGDDFIGMEDALVGEDFVVYAGTGKDYVGFFYDYIQGDTFLNLGEGQDGLMMRNTQFEGLFYLDD